MRWPRTTAKASLAHLFRKRFWIGLLLFESGCRFIKRLCILDRQATRAWIRIGRATGSEKENKGKAFAHHRLLPFHLRSTQRKRLPCKQDSPFQT